MPINDGLHTTVSHEGEKGAEKLLCPTDTQDRILDIVVTMFLLHVCIMLLSLVCNPFNC